MAKTPIEIKSFYVYRIFGEMGETVYVGKGSGRRLQKQKRRFGADGEILEYFSTDKQAFRRERELIALHNPPLNKCSGGNGSTRGKAGRDGLIPLYEGLARIIRSLSGLEAYARKPCENLVFDVAEKQGLEKFRAGLLPYGIEIIFQ